MGTFSVPMEVGTLDGQSYETIEALVDTGASYTVAPASLLNRLGITPREHIEFELADGRIIELGIGETRVRIDGRDAVTLVVFGEEGVSPLLGAYTLESVRLAVAPLRQLLVPPRALLLRATRRTP